MYRRMLGRVGAAWCPGVPNLDPSPAALACMRALAQAQEQQRHNGPPGSAVLLPAAQLLRAARCGQSMWRMHGHMDTVSRV